MLFLWIMDEEYKVCESLWRHIELFFIGSFKSLMN